MHRQTLARRTFLNIPLAGILLKVGIPSLKNSSEYENCRRFLDSNNGNTVKVVLPDNWRDGPEALNNARFNPHARSIPAIKSIYQRRRRVPHPAYAVMGTVLELRKPLGELPEDSPSYNGTLTKKNVIALLANNRRTPCKPEKKPLPRTT